MRYENTPHHPERTQTCQDHGRKSDGFISEVGMFLSQEEPAAVLTPVKKKIKNVGIFLKVSHYIALKSLNSSSSFL